VVTAPGSGAETIPFLKTWVNLPMAIGFTVLYSKVRPPRIAGRLAPLGAAALTFPPRSACGPSRRGLRKRLSSRQQHTVPL